MNTFNSANVSKLQFVNVEVAEEAEQMLIKEIPFKVVVFKRLGSAIVIYNPIPEYHMGNIISDVVSVQEGNYSNWISGDDVLLMEGMNFY